MADNIGSDGTGLDLSKFANPFTLGLSALQAGYGLYKANELADTPYPKATISPELQKAYERSLQNVGRGYTPEEDAAFKSNLASQSRLGFQNAKDMAGGQLSGAINRGIQATNLPVLANYAKSGAELGRQNTRYSDSLAADIQRQKNLITQQEIAHRNQLEQAYGGALQSGLTNAVNTLNLNDALKMYNGLYGSGKQPVDLSRHIFGTAGGRPGDDDFAAPQLGYEKPTGIGTTQYPSLYGR